MKNLFLLTTLTTLSAGFVFAAPTIQQCTAEIKAQQQANPSTPGITDAQALKYCQCAVPQINKLSTNKNDLTDEDIFKNQSKINNILSVCSQTAGLQNNK